MKSERKTITGALITLAIGLFFRIDALKIKVFKGVGATAINSATFPIIWADIMIALCVWILIRSFIRIRKQKNSSEEQSKSSKGKFLNQIVEGRETILTLCLMAIYYAMMDTLGFIISTLLYLYLQMLLLQAKGERNYTTPAIIASIATAAIYYIFRYQLEIVLPQGLLAMI